MREPITSELRCLAAMMERDKLPPFSRAGLEAVADRIDQEHERRMADSRREMRRAVIRYLRSVLTDYERGVKRVRKEKRQ